MMLCRGGGGYVDIHTFFFLGINWGFIFRNIIWIRLKHSSCFYSVLNVVIKVMDVCLDTFKIYLYFSLSLSMCVFFWGIYIFFVVFFCSVFKFSLTFLVSSFFYCCRNTISARGFFFFMGFDSGILGFCGLWVSFDCF